MDNFVKSESGLSNNYYTDYFADGRQEWHQKYIELDELVARIDAMTFEINQLRLLIEQKMADIDRFFVPAFD